MKIFNNKNEALKSNFIKHSNCFVLNETLLNALLAGKAIFLEVEDDTGHTENILLSRKVMNEKN